MHKMTTPDGVSLAYLDEPPVGSDRGAPLARMASCAILLYRPSTLPGLVEVASVHGREVALPVHFHDEDQVTFVVSGRRRFQIGGRLVEVAAGRAVFIEAGLPHGSLDEPEPVVCLNTYLHAGVNAERHDAAEGLVTATRRRWEAQRALAPVEVASLVQMHQRPAVNLDGGRGGRARCVRGTVTDAAAEAGMSREGFSRAFRRTHGVTPSAFRGLAALNHARRLLRAGVPLAWAAAEAGFADQSHLGRCFRRAFGVTPGHYRNAWSHPFQTEPSYGA